MRRAVQPHQRSRAAHTSGDIPASHTPATVERQFGDAISRALELEKILRVALPTSVVRPLGAIADITPAMWKDFNTLVLAGVTPVVAAQQTFYMSAMEFNRAMKDGARAPSGALVAVFASAVNAVRCRARAIAEARVFYENPLAALGGPLGRGDDNEPGWSMPRDAGGAAVQVNVNVMSTDERRERIAVLQQKALQSGGDDATVDA